MRKHPRVRVQRLCLGLVPAADRNAARKAKQSAVWSTLAVNWPLKSSQSVRGPERTLRSRAYCALSSAHGIGQSRSRTATWGPLGWTAFNAGQIEDAEKAEVKSALHARAAGDTALEMDHLVDSTVYAAYRPMPVDKALTVCREILARVAGHREAV